VQLPLQPTLIHSMISASRAERSYGTFFTGEIRLRPSAVEPC
jgi:hypothetical protein